LSRHCKNGKDHYPTTDSLRANFLYTLLPGRDFRAAKHADTKKKRQDQIVNSPSSNPALHRVGSAHGTSSDVMGVGMNDARWCHLGRYRTMTLKLFEATHIELPH